MTGGIIDNNSDWNTEVNITGEVIDNTRDWNEEINIIQLFTFTEVNTMV